MDLHIVHNSTLTLCSLCNTIAIMKTAVVHTRLEPEMKKNAEVILNRLGLSPTEAIRMFYTQITLRNGLPFPVDLPNEESRQALRDSRSGKNLERFENVDDLINSWDA